MDLRHENIRCRVGPIQMHGMLEGLDRELRARRVVLASAQNRSPRGESRRERSSIHRNRHSLLDEPSTAEEMNHTRLMLCCYTDAEAATHRIQVCLAPRQ
jgi:hypothetical protein